MAQAFASAGCPTIGAVCLLSIACRKDELARVKAAGARVLTLEQLDGLRVSWILVFRSFCHYNLGCARMNPMQMCTCKEAQPTQMGDIMHPETTAPLSVTWKFNR